MKDILVEIHIYAETKEQFEEYKKDIEREIKCCSNTYLAVYDWIEIFHIVSSEINDTTSEIVETIKRGELND